MKHTGIEQVIADALLTDKVRARIGVSAAEDLGLSWRSFPQMFGSTCGPWPGFGGAAMTTFQVTVARSSRTGQVLVFAGSDLFAFGAGDTWLRSQVTRGEIDFPKLADYGLVILDRPLP